MNKLLGTIFDSETAADSGLKALCTLHAAGDITLFATAVVARDAKAEAFRLQLSLARGDATGRVEDRMKRVKSAHHARSAKLSQAWSLTKEALAV